MAENQKDLVLSPNEYAFVLDETKGNVQCAAGPYKMSLSQSDRLVKFDAKRKKFIPVERYSEAIQLFTICPEGWYIALKNPAANNRHPTAGTANAIPENMSIGRKVNIPGPASFALYPGQMTEVIKGHTLRSNQYLVARVYDADSLNDNTEAEEPASGIPEAPRYTNGQILIIKGTECSFYIPPTGIEVKAIENKVEKGYVRDAVTLERLEYCILKDEDGNKRYVHGPAVVFPEPTESFIRNEKNELKYRAVELSDIVGVYVKVIADYKDEKGKEHKTGEELFITGKDQMIYYPRPEHTFISYNGNQRYHAIAIPKGEGRYIMDRMTGEIKTVKGPAMYLPDPRTEVVVRRTLSRQQCELWYPGNKEVLEVNGHGDASNSNFIDLLTSAGSEYTVDYDTLAKCATSAATSAYVDAYTGTPVKVESHSGIERQNTFTKPRTISLSSSKYDGAVSVDIWTGYAVNVISKDGTRQVVMGPQTILLDYDQTLEMLELSTGKPKTTDNLERIAFLRHENGRVSDIINVETADFVTAQVKISYLVNFDKERADKWFTVDNYVKHMCDWARAAIKRAVKDVTIDEFCDVGQDIVVGAITDDPNDKVCLHYFDENGLMISDMEVLSIRIEDEIQRIIDDHRHESIEEALELQAARASAETKRELDRLQREQIALETQLNQFRVQQEHESYQKDFALTIERNKAADEENVRKTEVSKAIQSLKDEIAAAERERERLDNEQQIAYEKEKAEIASKREADKAANMKLVLEALGPELAAALKSSANSDMLQAIASAVSPYAIAKGESIADAVNTMLRGTTIDQLMDTMCR